jgi:hypothetical protein
MDYLERTIGGKKVIWLAAGNRYLLLEMPAYEVFQKLNLGLCTEEIINWCVKLYHLSPKKAAQFVKEVGAMTKQNIQKTDFLVDPQNLAQTIQIPLRFYSTKFYKINSTLFSASFENQYLEHLIHPKFSHLEVNADIHPCETHIRIFPDKEQNVMMVNNHIIGMWPPEEDHYLSGKFSLELINLMYQKQESDWMATFHATAISKENQCVIFLGTSGSGKSTLAALLMANGFELLADDFVPVDTSGEAFFFPAAVSVKKNAIKDLEHLFPELVSAREFSYPERNKTIRYLPPTDNTRSHCPCKALVFVKYQEGHPFVFRKTPKELAFQQLIPDSWISPLAQNANCFLDWFLQKQSYQLTYSDNEKMVKAVHELFSNDI